MTWTVGYPQAFLYLDDEHESLGRCLDRLRDPAGEDEKSSTKLKALELLRLLRQHFANEEAAMESTGFSERDLHAKYHQVAAESLETILSMFDQTFVQKHRTAITDHIESRLMEEVFVDTLFAAFLRNHQEHIA